MSLTITILMIACLGLACLGFLLSEHDLRRFTRERDTRLRRYAAANERFLL